jgi:hypothetical protein
MRDIKRIDRILAQIKKLWLLSPDERFGQFCHNNVFGDRIDFMEEDTVLEKRLKKLHKQILAIRASPEFKNLRLGDLKIKKAKGLFYLHCPCGGFIIAHPMVGAWCNKCGRNVTKEEVDELIEKHEEMKK